MKNEVIEDIMRNMAPYLDDDQMRELKGTLHICLHGYDIQKKKTEVAIYKDRGTEYLRRFLVEKGAAGLSERTLGNYKFLR